LTEAALVECDAHEAVGEETTVTDLGPLLGAAPHLEEVRACALGHRFLLGGRAPALRVLDLRGAHLDRWPAGLGDATGLEELLLGFSVSCTGHDYDIDPRGYTDQHISFDLASPPTLPSLRRLVLIHARVTLSEDERPLAWAVDLDSSPLNWTTSWAQRCAPSMPSPFYRRRTSTSTAGRASCA
jgi:hypothetical protein